VSSLLVRPIRMTDSNNDLLFAAVNLPDIREKSSAANQILSLSNQQRVFNKARNFNQVTLAFYNNKTKQSVWAADVPLVVRDWTEKYMWPWIGHPTKLTALIAAQNNNGKIHVDCTVEKIGSPQPGIRLMLQGKTSDIYFKTDRGAVMAPDVSGPFIMDVGYPHAWTNTGAKPAVLLAFPYQSDNNFITNDLITVYLNKSNHGLPPNAAQYCVD